MFLTKRTGERILYEVVRPNRIAGQSASIAAQSWDFLLETTVKVVQLLHFPFAILHNQNVNEVRRAARDAQVTNLQDWSESLVATTDPTASRRLRELECALGGLADEQRQIILLVGLEGMSCEDAP
jgi:hypothetical protein